MKNFKEFTNESVISKIKDTINKIDKRWDDIFNREAFSHLGEGKKIGEKLVSEMDIMSC